MFETFSHAQRSTQCGCRANATQLAQTMGLLAMQTERSCVACFTAVTRPVSTVDLTNALTQAGCQQSKHQEQRMIEPFSCPACLRHLAHADGRKASNASALRQAIASQKNAALHLHPHLLQPIPAHRHALKNLLKKTGVCKHCGARQREWISRTSPLLYLCC